VNIRPETRRWLLAAALLVPLTVCHTWPLATDPAHLSRNNNADTLLNTWIVSWVAHQLPANPRRLFDANIFHPEPNTLALSEPLILPGIAAIPLRAAGASPVLTYNLLLLAGFALTGLGMFAFVSRLTGDPWAGLFAGALLAFNAHTLTRLPHLQAVFAPGLPLAFWALDRILTGDRTRAALLWLAAAMVSVALTSLYLTVFTALGLLVVWAVQTPWWWRQARPVVGRLLLAGAIAVPLMLPVFIPYWHEYHDAGFERDLADIMQFSGSLRMYATTAATLHYTVWSHTLFGTGSDTFFPGIAATAMALIGAVAAWRSPSRRWVVALIALGVVAVLLSLGPATPVYRVLYQILLPLGAIRGVARFGVLFLFAVAVLAGLGLAGLRSRWPARTAMPVTAVLLALVTLEALHLPIPYARFEGIPRIYEVVAGLPDTGALAELPMYPSTAIFRNGAYVLASTVHWRPLVNGYSGFVPASYVQSARALRAFPTRRSLAFLERLGVRLLIVHPDRFAEPEARRILSRLMGEPWPQLELIGIDEEGRRLYRLHPAAAGSVPGEGTDTPFGPESIRAIAPNVGGGRDGVGPPSIVPPDGMPRRAIAVR